MAGSGLLTYDDLLAYDDDGIRREILDGVLTVTPPPNLRHQEIAFRLAVALELHVRDHGGGRVFIGPVGARLSEHTYLEPDVAFVADDRARLLDPRFIDGPPTLVIEVVSDSRHDRIRKRGLYARSGVPEYWIADPTADRVEVLRLAGTTYAKPEIFEPGEMLTTPALPGLAIDLAEIFRRA
jgi:Uma2 family endonuclease